MADNTAIEWTEATWNPIAGCSVLSPGCAHCYAMPMAARIEKMMAALGKPTPYAGLTQPSKAGPVWNGRIAVASDETLTQPLRWKRPRRIFVNSMSDLFHEGVADETIDRIFAVMALCPQHTFQVLTKRAARMRAYMATPNRENIINGRVWSLLGTPRGRKIEHGGNWRAVLPLPNVWLGVSTEDQARADERIPHLLATPAAVRFISAEPLLGAIDLRCWLEVPTQIDQNFGRLRLLNDEERQDSAQYRLGIAHAGDLPYSDRLPPVPLDALCAPSDIAPPVALQPVHDISGGAVDREACAIRPASSTAPIEVSLAVEQTGKVGHGRSITGDGDALLSEYRAGSAGKPLPCNFPLDAGPTGAEPLADRGDGFSGAVGLSDGQLPCRAVSGHDTQTSTLDWVIAGGESGPRARPSHPDWFRSLRDQCAAAEVPFFFKQWGSWGPVDPTRKAECHAIGNDGSHYRMSDLAWPNGVRRGEAIRADFDKTRACTIYRVGKKAAGAELDGKLHREFPP